MMDMYNVTDVKALVEELMGREVEIKSIGNHALLKNAVYRVDYGQKKVIFKLYRKKNRCNREVATLKLLENAKTISPVLLDKGTVDDEIEWIFISYLPGVPFQKVRNQLEEADCLALMKQIGKSLRSIHDAVHFDYFGEWACKQNNFSKNMDFKSAFKEKFDVYAQRLAPQNDFEANLFERGIEYVENHMAILSQVGLAYICHNDFDSRNILVKKIDNHWQVSGIIDFEHSYPWDAEADLVGLYMEGLRDNPAWEKAFFEGYASERYREEAFQSKMDFYLVARSLEVCSWASNHEPNYFDRGLQWLEKLLNQ